MSKYSRISRFAFLFFAFAIYGFSQTPTATPPEDAPEKIYIEEISLNFSAFDPGGRFVADVQKEDLVILENGRLHQATSVRRVPASVLVVLDAGGAVRYAKNANATRAAAKTLIGALRAENRFAVLQYHDRVETLADWTSDKARVLDVLDKKIGYGRRSVFFQALDAAVLFFDRAPRENRHLVLIADGTDSFNDQKTKEAAIKNLLASDINVHVISYTRLQRATLAPKKEIRQEGEPRPQRLPEAGLLGLPDPKTPRNPDEVTPREFAKIPRLSSINLDREMRRRQKEDLKKLDAAERFLQTISEDANGEFFLPEHSGEMIENSAFVAETIDSQYVLTYAPKVAVKESATEQPREIEASSKRSGLRVYGKRKLVIKTAGKLD
jgi:Mg-chelatase subunit ChlD